MLEKIAEALVSEQPVSAIGLTAEERATISAHNFYSSKPVVVAAESELNNPDALLVRAFAAGGWISFLTVGGMGNPA